MYMCRPSSKSFSSSQDGNEMEWNGVGIETLYARLTLNLWRQEILGRITWRRCSSCLPYSVSSVSNIIVHFPFAFGYWKIMIIFPASGTLQNILQNISSKLFCKHYLLFSNITIMKWIHGIQCWKHLNPNLPHACVTESFGHTPPIPHFTIPWKPKIKSPDCKLLHQLILIHISIEYP